MKRQHGGKTTQVAMKRPVWMETIAEMGAKVEEN
jgi:hypothetical protein